MSNMCKCKVPYSNILVVYGLCQLDISIKPRICIYILYCTVYSISLHTRDIAFTELWGFNSKIFPLQLKKLAWDSLFVKQGNKWVGRWFQTTPPPQFWTMETSKWWWKRRGTSPSLGDLQPGECHRNESQNRFQGAIFRSKTNCAKPSF